MDEFDVIGLVDIITGAGDATVSGEPWWLAFENLTGTESNAIPSLADLGFDQTELQNLSNPNFYQLGPEENLARAADGSLVDPNGHVVVTAEEVAKMHTDVQAALTGGTGGASNIEPGGTGGTGGPGSAGGVSGEPGPGGTGGTNVGPGGVTGDVGTGGPGGIGSDPGLTAGGVLAGIEKAVDLVTKFFSGNLGKALAALGLGGLGLALSKAIAGNGTNFKIPALTPLPLTPGQKALEEATGTPEFQATLKGGLLSAAKGQEGLSNYLNERLAYGRETQQQLDPLQRQAAIGATTNAGRFTAGATLPGLEGQRRTQDSANAVISAYLSGGRVPGTESTDAIRTRALSDLGGTLGLSNLPVPTAGVTPQNYAQHGWAFDSSGVFTAPTGAPYRWSGTAMEPASGGDEGAGVTPQNYDRAGWGFDASGLFRAPSGAAFRWSGTQMVAVNESFPGAGPTRPGSTQPRPIPGTEDAAALTRMGRAGLTQYMATGTAPGSADTAALRTGAISDLTGYQKTGTAPVDPVMAKISQYIQDVMAGNVTNPILTKASADEQERLNNELGRRGMTGEASASAPAIYARSTQMQNEAIRRYIDQQQTLAGLVPQYENAQNTAVSNRLRLADYADANTQRVIANYLRGAEYGDTATQQAYANRLGLAQYADTATQRALNTAQPNVNTYANVANNTMRVNEGFLNLGQPNLGQQESVQGSIFPYARVTGAGTNVRAEDVQQQRDVQVKLGLSSQIAQLQAKQSLANQIQAVLGRSAAALTGSGAGSPGQFTFNLGQSA